jgi:hypothetical protein
MYTAVCRFGGVLCGAGCPVVFMSRTKTYSTDQDRIGCPIVFMSRADSTQTRLHSLALALRLIAPPA